MTSSTSALIPCLAIINFFIAILALVSPLRSELETSFISCFDCLVPSRDIKLFLVLKKSLFFLLEINTTRLKLMM